VLAHFCGLLGQSERKKGVDARRGRRRGLTDGMQRLRMGDWDADAVGDVLRGYVRERLCTDGVLTVHENGCIKQGIRSVGGPGGTPEPAARSTTARSALSACVTGVSGVLIDRELPLRGPEPTTAAGPPASTTNVGFAAKSDRARRTLQRVIDAGDALRPRRCAAARPADQMDTPPLAADAELRCVLAGRLVGISGVRPAPSRRSWRAGGPDDFTPLLPLGAPAGG
jgi:hypothetical protein